MIDLPELTDIIYSVYEECGIHDFPIDCMKILKHYGFKVKTYSQLREKNPELYKLCVSYSNDAFSDIKSRFIAYNDKAHKRRVRFSLMHELGHFILKHTERTQQQEDEADMFASHILVPRTAMGEASCFNADKVHDVFEVSFAAANRCMADYKKCIDDYPTVLRDKRISERFFPGVPSKFTTPEEFINKFFFSSGFCICVTVRKKEESL